MKVVKSIPYKSFKERIRIVNYYLNKNYKVEVFDSERFVYVENKVNRGEMYARDAKSSNK